VLAGDALFMAGPPRIDSATTRDLLATLTRDPYDPPPALREALESFSGVRGGLLCALRASDGEKIWQGELHSVPVFDGLIAAHGRLYISLQDGAVTSLCGSDSS
jgi:hypothetical protein